MVSKDKKKKIKALVLFSGGLDSLLAAKLLQDQNIEVIGICFKTNFFDCQKAVKTARDNKIKLETIDISKEFLAMAKRPPHGYGKNINPCIDCHGLMIKKVSLFAKKNNYDFIATGEVLGQRPFSQTKDSLQKVNQGGGAEVLRPLSAKLLPQTEIEKNGLVERSALLDINGRNRKIQMDLVKKYKLKSYETPGGGCLLTDPTFSKRLSQLFQYFPNCDVKDAELIKLGRVFWLDWSINKKILAIITRNREENIKLSKLEKRGDTIIKLSQVKGPMALIRKSDYEPLVNQSKIKVKTIPKNEDSLRLTLKDAEDHVLSYVGFLTAWYKTNIRGREVGIKIKPVDKCKKLF